MIYAQVDKPETIIGSSVDYDKAKALKLADLKRENPNRLQKAPAGYLYSLDKEEGYVEAYVMDFNGEPIEIYVFKDKKALISFLRLSGQPTGSWKPSGSDGTSSQPCDCPGGISCSCGLQGPIKVFSIL